MQVVAISNGTVRQRKEKKLQHLAAGMGRVLKIEFAMESKI